NTNPIASPSEVFDCIDGKVIIAVGNNLQFRQFCQAVDLLELLELDEFSSNAKRVQHRDKLRSIIAPTVEKMSRAELMEKLNALGVPSGPLNEISDVFETPQSQHRQLAVQLRHGTGQQISVLKNPFGMESMSHDYAPPPTLGADTEAVLREYAGVDKEPLESVV